RHQARFGDGTTRPLGGGAPRNRLALHQGRGGLRRSVLHAPRRPLRPKAVTAAPPAHLHRRSGRTARAEDRRPLGSTVELRRRRIGRGRTGSLTNRKSSRRTVRRSAATPRRSDGRSTSTSTAERTPPSSQMSYPRTPRLASTSSSSDSRHPTTRLGWSRSPNGCAPPTSSTTRDERVGAAPGRYRRRLLLDGCKERMGVLWEDSDLGDPTFGKAEQLDDITRSGTAGRLRLPCLTAQLH